MKNVKRTLSFALALVLALSLLCIPGLADSGKIYPKYENYMCVGDSISAGNTLGNGLNDIAFTRVPGAYHDLVATALDANLLQYGCSAFRAIELRYILDGVYTDYDGIWGAVFAHAFDVQNLDYLTPYFIDGFKKADLISINLGSNDVLTYSVIKMMAQMGQDNSDPKLEAIKANLEKTGDVGAALLKLVELYESLNKIGTLISDLNKSLSEALNTFKTNWEIAVKEIYKLNPDVTIVAVGAYNPFDDVVISEGSDVNLGLIFQPTINKINNFLKDASRYDGKYLFADVTGTEIYGLSLDDPEFAAHMTPNVHPNRNGHAFMAQQILKAINAVPYVDVSENAWYIDGVKYCYHNDIMGGVSDKLFVPGAVSTRAQLAAVLYRMAGSPDVSGLTEPFIDVPNSYWAHDAIVWAYNNDISKGVTTHTFMPAAAITRGQFVTMLYRYAGSPEVTGELNFNDSCLIANAFENAVIWASENGIVQGYQNGCFGANVMMTRAQMAVIIARYCQM